MRKLLVSVVCVAFVVMGVESPSASMQIPSDNAIEDIVLDALQKHLDDDEYYVTGTGEQLDSERIQNKLRNATEASFVPPFDAAVAFLDCTWFGSAGENLIFGRKGVYYRTSWMRSAGPRVGFIDYPSFIERSFEKSGWWPEVSLDYGLHFVTAGCSVSTDVLLEVLEEVRDALAAHGRTALEQQVSTYDTQTAAPIKLHRRELAVSQPTSAKVRPIAVFAEAQSSHYRPRVVGVTSENLSGSSSLGALIKHDADLAIGSGFLESFHPLRPLGLLIVDGVEISGIRGSGFDSIVAIVDDQVAILSQDEYEDGAASGAFQTGPWLVRNGEVQIDTQEPRLKRPATRSWLALCNGGIVLAGVSTSPIHLFDLAMFIQSPEDNGGFACPNAVNLAGGGSESLVLADLKGGRTTFGNASSRQASLLVFERLDPN